MFDRFGTDRTVEHVSVPTFIGFNWQWVVLFLVLGGTALYLQTFIPLLRLPAEEPE